MKNLIEQYSGGLYNLSQQEFPEQVMQEAKNCLLDYLGVTFVGAYLLKAKSKRMLELFDSPGDIPVIGLETNSTICHAILLNGIHAHYIELDDGHRVAMMHPGAPIISALLPFAQQKNLSGKDLLKGIVVGYEAAIRLASALQPSLKEKGFHGTGIAGTVGVAAAIATAMNFPNQAFKDALSAASTSASGILKVIKDISELKPYNVGNAAQSGYVAAMLAQSGFQGPYDAFEGKLGFLSMYSDKVKEQYLEFKDTDVLSILKIYRKPYAACRHCHAPIEAALMLQQQTVIPIESIKSVQVQTYALGVAGHDHTDIVSINSAKMSTPYSIAVALIKGRAGLAEFTMDVINDAKITALAKKVNVVADAELSALVPQKRAAIVNVETNDGQIFRQRVDYPKGEPENPISDMELKNKFISLAKYSGKEENDCQSIINCIENIETALHKLFSLL